jgi:hypothetical protein
VKCLKNVSGRRNSSRENPSFQSKKLELLMPIGGRGVLATVLSQVT